MVDRDANEMNESSLLPKHSDIENINSLLLKIGSAVFQGPSNLSPGQPANEKSLN